MAWVIYFPSPRVTLHLHGRICSLHLLQVSYGRALYRYHLWWESSFSPTPQLCCPSPLPTASIWCLGLSNWRSSLQRAKLLHLMLSYKHMFLRLINILSSCVCFIWPVYLRLIYILSNCVCFIWLNVPGIETSLICIHGQFWNMFLPA